MVCNRHSIRCSMSPRVLLPQNMAHKMLRLCMQGPTQQSASSCSRVGMRLLSQFACSVDYMRSTLNPDPHCECAGAYTAKRYSLWQSRQAVLNAQLAGPTGASSNQLDTETAAADAIAALGTTPPSPPPPPPNSTPFRGRDAIGLSRASHIPRLPA